MVFNIFSIKHKTSTPTTSTPVSSASSIASNDDLATPVKKSSISKALTKFLADPMRSSNHPDVVGEYVDPMGGSISRTPGYDPMSTGA